jgi:cyclin-dependent kinase 8/11
MGCIFGELLGLRPMFKGEEAKIEIGGGAKKGGVQFQKDQLSRIIEVLGNIDSTFLDYQMTSPMTDIVA